MGDLFFFLRVMLLTTVVVLFMQIRWGNSTIENHAMDFITSSSIVKPLDDVASGSVRFIRNTWTGFMKNINTNFASSLRKENQPGERQSMLNLERSQAYVREKAAKTHEAVKKKIRGQFIDETVVPGEANRASSTGDDDALVEE